MLDVNQEKVLRNAHGAEVQVHRSSGSRVWGFGSGQVGEEQGKRPFSILASTLGLVRVAGFGFGNRERADLTVRRCADGLRSYVTAFSTSSGHSRFLGQVLGG
jgi:hypothetical protein